MTATSHCEIRVRVTPNAVKNEIVSLTEGVLQVKIAAPPVDGKANRELAVYLSWALGVGRSSLTIAKGMTSRHKVIAIDGLSRDEAFRRLGL